MIKRWIIVTGDFTPHGGMDRVNHGLVQYLCRQPEYEVHAVGHRFEHDLGPGAGLICHPVPRPLASDFLGAPLLARRGRKVAGSYSGKDTTVIVNGANCAWLDVSWIHYVHAAYMAPPRAAEWRGRWSAWRQRVYRDQEKALLPRMRLLLANSRRTKEDLIERLQIASEKIKVIYYGCDAREVFPRSETFRREKRRTLPFAAGRNLAIFVGALGDGRKGFETIYQVWERGTRQSDWNLDLLVVGSGATQPWWEQKAREAGLDRWMHFLGFRSDVLEWIGASDVMLHPARYEAYGLGVHEAICSGVPAIVSAQAGVAERLENSWPELLLQDPRDPEELMEKIQSWKKRQGEYRTKAGTESDLWRRQDREEMARQIVKACEAG